MAAELDLKKFLSRFKSVFKQTQSQRVLKALGKQSIFLIKKRTRLGYGVRRDYGKKKKLIGLSENYVQYRKDNKQLLNKFTRPSRSNLTFTGQMLDSMKIRKIKRGRLTIGPYGRRRGENLTNQKLAQYVEQNGRPFNHLSQLEIKQLQRFYRKTFGDLVNKYKL